jgi:hypothetical protein
MEQAVQLGHLSNAMLSAFFGNLRFLGTRPQDLLASTLHRL